MPPCCCKDTPDPGPWKAGVDDGENSAKALSAVLGAIAHTTLATATREFLIAQGVKGSRISSIAYGKERPAALCDAEQCWSQNRRAVTVITGGASGTGLATARRFADEGAHVVVADLDPASGEAAAQEVGDDGD